MKKVKFLDIVKALIVFSLLGLVISIAVENNHACSGEECDVCNIFSVIFLVSFTLFLTSSLSLIIYIKLLLSQPYWNHQKQDLELTKPIYESNDCYQNISLITLKMKLQIAM